MKQIPLPIASAAAPSFENFIVGANAPAIDEIQRIGPGSAPLYLWGPAGSGKTHLLRALAGRATSAGVRVAYFDAADAACCDDATGLVVLDDCERFDAAHQHAAFAAFVLAATHGVPVAAAGRLPPVDLPLRDDLRSRLGSGPVFALQPLAEAQVRAALRREADRRGLFLPDELVNYLLTRFERDLGHLMAQLERLDRYALVTKRALTLPLLRQMLAEEATS
ncbi:MAG: DnaA regulatory inactivator Hda [Burkholderiaceae bacterium]